MKASSLLTAALLITSSCFALAESPTPAPPTPTLLGIWYLGSRACTSNAIPKDDLEIGTDTVQMTYNADLSFEEKIVKGGCETVRTGTYALDDRKIITNFKDSKTCKEPKPVPATEAKVTYLAYLDENESVTVTTGSEAALYCPAGDALVKIFSKIILQ